jgi:hypothetical protein
MYCSSLRTTLLAVLLPLISSCGKDDRPLPERIPDPGPTSQVAPKAKCPKQTVDFYTDLAAFGDPWFSAGPSHLNAVFDRCYGIRSCGPAHEGISTYYDHTDWSIVGCAKMGAMPQWPIPPMSSWPLITYTDQRAIIDYFRSIAEANAPTCGKSSDPMVVVDMEFYRDTNLPNDLCAYVRYACCRFTSNGNPSTE